jgi:hypothetical protein
MSSKTERPGREEVLAELPSEYHGVFTAYEDFLEELRMQSEAEAEGASPVVRTELGRAIEEDLVGIVNAVREVRHLSSRSYVLASSLAEMETSGSSFCYAFGAARGDNPYMQHAHVFSLVNQLLGCRMWMVDPNFPRPMADSDWKYDQAVTSRVAKKIIGEYLPPDIAEVILKTQ